MFLFNKTTPKLPEKVTEHSTFKRDTLILDYLAKIDVELPNYGVLYIHLSKLQNQKLKTLQRQSLIETFENVIKKNGGEIFGLPNDDMVVFYHQNSGEEIQACLVKIRFMFHDDPLLQNAFDLEQAGFVKFYSLAAQVDEFKKTVQSLMDSLKNQTLAAGGNVSPKTPQAAMMAGSRKLRRELTPAMLAKVQKTLAMADFSSLIRRQSVCAVIGKSPPQMIFDEVFVSIADFDENINPSMRSTIVLELQLVDIFSDIKAFILAKTFAQYRGYKICIDGVTVDKLKYIDREQLNGDLLKIIWHPSFMDMVREDSHFTDYANRAERAKMILCRVDDPQAVEVGNSLGINLYQGRYIQRMLTAQPKKTIFTIK